MKQAWLNAVNISLGFIIMVSALSSIFSFLAVYDGLPDGNLFSGLISLFVIILCLTFIFFVNKPSSNDVKLAVWLMKWKLAIFVVVAVIVAFGLYSIEGFRELLKLHFMVGQLPIPYVKFSLFLMCMFLGQKFVNHIWYCPSCRNPLPFGLIGKSQNVGFGIVKCSKCEIELNDP